MEAFLARLGLPSTERYPHYPAMPRPPATHGAALQDAAAVPYLMEAGQADYRRFLAAPLPWAFAIGPGGDYGRSAGAYDTPARALRNCGRGFGQCRL